MEQMQGTPITRSGGYSIRVGWHAVLYSVNRDTERRYRLMKILLLVLAIFVGILVVKAAEQFLFEFIAPLVSSRTVLIKNYPAIWQLLIYGLTLGCGAVIYLQCVAMWGNRMVAGSEPRDEGLTLMEQRRRSADVRKRDIATLMLIPILFWLGPTSFGTPLKAFVTLLVAARLAEIIYFRVIGK